MSNSSLSSVVSNLVRASMGTSVTSTVTDDDLDRHVAELILKEAKQKAERYGKDGIRAYLPNLTESNAPRTNKRFLTSIIRSTDDHNKTILRAQALAAEEVKRAREEQERKERKARAEEAVAAERMRRLMGGGRRSESDSWDRGSRKRKSRSWERVDDDFVGDRELESGSNRRRESHRRRSRSGERSHRGEKRSRRYKTEPSSRRRARSRSRSPVGSSEEGSSRKGRKHQSCDSRRSRHTRSRSRSHARHSCSSSTKQAESSQSRKTSKRLLSADPLDDIGEENKPPTLSRTRSPSFSGPDIIDMEAELRQKLKAKHKRHNTPDRHTSIQRSPFDDRDPASPKPTSSYTASTMSLSRSPTPAPSPESRSQLPSKMDKYFEDSYDPRLDVAPLSAPKVPKTGLIDNSEFEGWDAMLELIRIRREDKEEKKRMERLGLTKEKLSKKLSKKGGDAGSVADRWGAEGVSIMDIEYRKKGSVREWDMGKDGF